MGMRRDEEKMKRLALGDYQDSPDWGRHEPSRFPAMARKRPEYRAMPTDEAIRQKYEDEIKAQVGPLMRLRETFESANITAELHPIHDSPFLANDVVFSSGVQTIAPATVDGVNTIAGPVDGRHIEIIRTIRVITFDALADDDITISVRVNGVRVRNLIAVRPSVFQNYRQNVMLMAFEGRQIDVLVSNNSAVMPHDVRVEAHGWRYPLPEVKETARGIMPRVT